MIDWSLVAEIALGGFFITILVLLILCVIAWIVGIIVQKTKAGAKEAPEKDK